MKVIINWPSEIPLSETLGNEWTLTLITCSLRQKCQMSINLKTYRDKSDRLSLTNFAWTNFYTLLFIFPFLSFLHLTI